MNKTSNNTYIHGTQFVYMMHLLVYNITVITNIDV